MLCYMLGLIEREQELPAEAFISLGDLMAGTTSMGLPVIALSYPWLHPDHPDPLGENLRRVAVALFAYLRRGRRWGVFIDYMCMPQPPERGRRRTEQEAEQFEAALAAMSILYTHPQEHSIAQHSIA